MKSAIFALIIAVSCGSSPPTQDDEHLMLLQTRAKAITNTHERDDASVENADIAQGDAFKSGLHGGASSIVRLLDFKNAKVVYNNLGGQGPDQSAPEEIRYRNLVVGQPVDLKIVADPGYSVYNNERNGIIGSNGQINAKSGTAAGLQFMFVEEGTDVPHVMPQFYMTFSDIDERHGGDETEKIVVDSFDKFYTNDDLTLENPNYLAEGQQPSFKSSEYGNYADNELNPDSPDALMLSHAVTYLFTNKSSFHATFSIDQSKNKEGKGRNVVFSGISQLVFCQEPSTYLNFKTAKVTVNNLGGQGPMVGVPKEIRYSGIANAKDGSLLDIVVTSDADYGYKPTNASQNGLRGDFGIINLYCGPTRDDSEVYTTFTIVKSGTSTPVVLDAFAFTVFDFDSGHHEQQIEYVETRPTDPGFDRYGTGYASYIVTSTTELEISDVLSVGGETAACADYCSGEIKSLKEDGLFEGPSDEICDPREGECHGCADCKEKGNNGYPLKRFSATRHGTESDNPTTSQLLSRRTADKSVVFTFRKASSFTMMFGITPSGFNTGRNFMFSGHDMYLMCD